MILIFFGAPAGPAGAVVAALVFDSCFTPSLFYAFDSTLRFRSCSLDPLHSRSRPQPDDCRYMTEADQGWLARLKQGLAKTRAGIVGLFSATRVDEALFEELETALVSA